MLSMNQLPHIECPEFALPCRPTVKLDCARWFRDNAIPHSRIRRKRRGNRRNQMRGVITQLCWSPQFYFAPPTTQSPGREVRARINHSACQQTLYRGRCEVSKAIRIHSGIVGILRGPDVWIRIITTCGDLCGLRGVVVARWIFFGSFSQINVGDLETRAPPAFADVVDQEPGDPPVTSYGESRPCILRLLTSISRNSFF